jgi:hypothetical protein
MVLSRSFLPPKPKRLRQSIMGARLSIFLLPFTAGHTLHGFKSSCSMEVVRRLAADGGDWAYYDQNFWYAREKSLYAHPWSVINWELHMKAKERGKTAEALPKKGNVQGSHPFRKGGGPLPSGSVGSATKVSTAPCHVNTTTSASYATRAPCIQQQAVTKQPHFSKINIPAPAVNKLGPPKSFLLQSTCTY